jgi:hypothetical protein
LLGIGVRGERLGGGANRDRVFREVLRARLTGTLALDTAVAGALPCFVNQLCEEFLPQPGRSLAETLLDPETDPDAVRAIKAYAKSLASRSSGDAERAVATALYYAAIASALLFHGQRITGYSYRVLALSFRVLAEKAWMLPELAEHFTEARRMCDEEAEDRDQGAAR